MSRRTLTLIVSGLLVIILGAFALLVPVPYAEMTPGPTNNVLGDDPSTHKPVITITGATTYPTTGGLNMVTVGVTDPNYSMNLFHALSDWLDPNTAIVPKETIYPDNQSQQQVQQQNNADFTDSEQSAQIAALCYLKVPLAGGMTVSQVISGGPSVGKLQAGDVVTAVDNTPLTCPDSLTNLVSGHHPGDVVTLTVKRGASTLTVPVTTYKSPSDPTKAAVGIGVTSAFTTPFKIDISLQGIGGPSAGLMFTLGVIDKLSPANLSGGRIVAGTGTIDDQGNVGPIGGVQMKLLAAKRDGATVFLVPADNCSEAKQSPPSDLRLVKVSTLTDAVNALTALNTGGPPPPSC